MDQNDHNKQHGEFKKAIEVLEDNVSKLWAKLDKMVIMVIAILLGVIANLGILIFK